MSEIHASIAQVESFADGAYDCATQVVNAANETSGHVSATINNANRALKNAGEALNSMLTDQANAQKAIDHNQKVLENLRRRLDVAIKEKAAAWENQCAAGAAYKRACEEQTRVNNSSESTPEARKAAAQAVKHASAAYSAAKNHYNAMCRLVTELQSKISQCATYIQRLQNILYSLSGQINQARDYIQRVTWQGEALQSEYKSFEHAAQSSKSTLESCCRAAQSAASSLSSAVASIAIASDNRGGSYRSEVIRMANGAETLGPMIRQMEENYHRNEKAIEDQRRRVKQYGTDLVDDISEAAMYAVLSICDHLRNVNILLDEIRVELRKAQKFLSEYASCENASIS